MDRLERAITFLMHTLLYSYPILTALAWWSL
jgi:hypothetical protein